MIGAILFAGDSRSVTAGCRGSATAGRHGFAMAGFKGTAKAGKGGRLIIESHDGERYRDAPISPFTIDGE